VCVCVVWRVGGIFYVHIYIKRTSDGLEERKVAIEPRGEKSSKKSMHTMRTMRRYDKNSKEEEPHSTEPEEEKRGFNEIRGGR